MPRGDTRARLLDAATAVVRQDGAQALTLDAVAAQAGVSKGGLLYHFRSKHELLEAMVTEWIDHFEREIEAAAEQEGGSFARGYVKACDPTGWAEAERASEFGLLAALIAEPDVLAKARKRYEAWQERLAGQDVDDTVARLAAVGLWIVDLLGLGPPTGELRQRVSARLLELAGD
jgi:AcrR family transcriptional regulator